MIIGFDANIDRLIQLYIVGVFTSFTLSQFGMVRHWQTAAAPAPRQRPARVAAEVGDGSRRSMRRAQAINAVGAVFTAVVLVVVFATKVAHGAWIAVAAMIVLFLAMRAINRYYARVTVEVAADDDAAAHPAQPGARPGAGVPAAQAGDAGAGAGPRHAARRDHRGHPRGRPRRDPQAAARSGRAGRSRCR